jgi:hypothetical protein
MAGASKRGVQAVDVETFCARIYKELDKDGWGDIEPEVFKNIANGFTGNEHPETAKVQNELSGNKLSIEEMLDSVAAMRKALKKALKEN